MTRRNQRPDAAWQWARLSPVIRRYDPDAGPHVRDGTGTKFTGTLGPSGADHVEYWRGATRDCRYKLFWSGAPHNEILNFDCMKGFFWF